MTGGATSHKRGLSLATLAAHAGLPRKPLLGGQNAESSSFPGTPQNAHVTPLFQNSVFDFDSISSGLDQVVGKGAYGYGRMGLPNAHELGAAVAALEGAEEGVATSSGMGAISAAILATVGVGDLVIAQHDAYGGTTEFFRRDLPRYGVDVRFEDTNNHARLEKLLLDEQNDRNLPEASTSRPVKVSENPSNGADRDSLPGPSKSSKGSSENQNGSTDDNNHSAANDDSEEDAERGMSGQSSAGFSASHHKEGVDATLTADSARARLAQATNRKARKIVIFAETVSNPLLVVSDVRALAALSERAGAVLMVDNTFGTPLRSRPLLEGADLVIHSATKFLGGHHDLLAGAVVGSARLIAPIRDFVKRMGLWAAPLDAWLAVRGIRTLQVRVEKAWANADVIGRRLSADPRTSTVIWHPRVALVTLAVAGGFAAADAAVAAFRLITLSTTLGGVTTTVSHPASSSHASLTADQRAGLGISDGHLRLSVRIEDAEDLWADLERGLSAAAEGSRAS